MFKLPLIIIQYITNLLEDTDKLFFISTCKSLNEFSDKIFYEKFPISYLCDNQTFGLDSFYKKKFKQLKIINESQYKTFLNFSRKLDLIIDEIYVIFSSHLDLQFGIILVQPSLIYFPPTVTKLVLGSDYQTYQNVVTPSTLYKNVLPESLTHLVLGYNFNFKLRPGCLPSKNLVKLWIL
ncbi:putative calmodulin-binding protein [Tieghemostelium lacteum]|uniref:Putative calmodulin-binding protein n=1 Tax=Tieghemostelium lacteum TaxID=361077 RepID=A0A151ZBG0_TIELA|nr:putative calmodulin-binding protein [Tieghemostelium lacteum]|eukprot:KYQ91276.1 putative calmodulin-binding protein [Tieghemostelium lacteum]